CSARRVRDAEHRADGGVAGDCRGAQPPALDHGRQERNAVKRGMAAKVFIGLAAGIAVGLFVGERAAALQLWADAYVKLLQMTVLPYVAVSLGGGLGSLSMTEASRLGSRVGLLLLGLWAVALGAVLLF